MKIVGNGGHAKVVREVWALVGPFASEDAAFIAVGDNKDRKKEAEAYQQYNFPVLIHPSAVISDAAHIGVGTVIMAGVVVQADAVIGDHCILNSSCVVDHDCVLEDFVHIAPGAALCGNVHVGEGALIGVGVGIAPNTVIQPWTVIKAHALRSD